MNGWMGEPYSLFTWSSFLSLSLSLFFVRLRAKKRRPRQIAQNERAWMMARVTHRQTESLASIREWKINTTIGPQRHRRRSRRGRTRKRKRKREKDRLNSFSRRGRSYFERSAPVKPSQTATASQIDSLISIEDDGGGRQKWPPSDTLQKVLYSISINVKWINKNKQKSRPSQSTGYSRSRVGFGKKNEFYFGLLSNRWLQFW